ncbi:MAG: holo-ACP synthase [Planctomycetota bacterium]|nr:holo-ACP synthase [Planctomycetota bacterium]
MSTTHTRLRHGIDLVYVPKFADLLARQPELTARLFTDAERAYCDRLPNPVPHYAARFAAKEAALKALGLGISPTGVDPKLKDIEVVRRGTAPHLTLHGKPAEHAQRLGVADSTVSLTHDGDHALASVIMVTKEAS